MELEQLQSKRTKVLKVSKFSNRLAITLIFAGLVVYVISFCGPQYAWLNTIASIIMISSFVPDIVELVANHKVSQLNDQIGKFDPVFFVNSKLVNLKYMTRHSQRLLNVYRWCNPIIKTLSVINIAFGLCIILKLIGSDNSSLTLLSVLLFVCSLLIFGCINLQMILRKKLDKQHVKVDQELEYTNKLIDALQKGDDVYRVLK